MSLAEPNGVAVFSREFVAFAGRQQLPFFYAHAGMQRCIVSRGSVTAWPRRERCSVDENHRELAAPGAQNPLDAIAISRNGVQSSQEASREQADDQDRNR